MASSALSREENDAIANKIMTQVDEFLQRMRNEDGRINFWEFLLTSVGDKEGTGPKDPGAGMGRLYSYAVDFANEFNYFLPLVAQLNQLEVKLLHQLANWGFPYWFATEWFLGGNQEVVCDEANLYYCLPPPALAWIGTWKELCGLVVGLFFMLLVGAMVGVMTTNITRKRSLKFVLGCVLLDMISAASLLLPLMGNVLDLVWAPLAGSIVSYMFDGDWRLGAVYFAKEAMVITDVIPMATMLALSGW
ncbi:hypothetical protein BASA81_005459 [Batrachochytrium salamandrivorans]|nr:hypothetical protein BASA81_005459 [Batrachochytrium salamandrivorans]